MAASIHLPAAADHSTVPAPPRSDLPKASSESSSPAIPVASNDSKQDFPPILKGRRILLATESLGPVNGVSRTTLSLIEYLRRHGVQLAVVAPHSKESRLKPRGSGISELRLPGYPLPYNPDLTVVNPFQLDDVYKRTFKPEIVYLASPASAGFQLLLQIRQLQEPPVVLLNFQTDLSAYSQILFPSLVARFSMWMLEVVQGFLFSHRTVHTIFYPSSGIRRYLEKAGAPKNRLVQLGRGVDTDLFDPSRRDEMYRKELAPNGEIILVCVCRLAPEKGFEFLAQVASRLVAESFPFKLLIVGGNLNPSVEEDVHRLFDPVKNHVVFTGFLTGVNLARAYASGDIFLHCSITETYGLVVLEGMASGLPVIARDEGGPSEIVRDQETGYLVPPQGLDQFISLVKQLSTNQSLRSTMAAAARQFTCDVTWDKINRRVAWKLAEGFEKHQQNIQLKKRRRQNKLWPISTYYHFKSGILQPVVVRIRLNIAVAMIYLVWMMAAVVLILYGNKVFSRARHILYNAPILAQQLRYDSFRLSVREALKSMIKQE